jgi:hypothetical protein
MPYPYIPPSSKTPSPERSFLSPPLPAQGAAVVSYNIQYTAFLPKFTPFCSKFNNFISHSLPILMEAVKSYFFLIHRLWMIGSNNKESFFRQQRIGRMLSRRSFLQRITILKKS